MDWSGSIFVQQHSSPRMPRRQPQNETSAQSLFGNKNDKNDRFCTEREKYWFDLCSQTEKIEPVHQHVADAKHPLDSQRTLGFREQVIEKLCIKIFKEQLKSYPENPRNHLQSVGLVGLDSASASTVSTEGFVGHVFSLPLGRLQLLTFHTTNRAALHLFETYNNIELCIYVYICR